MKKTVIAVVLNMLLVINFSQKNSIDIVYNGASSNSIFSTKEAMWKQVVEDQNELSIPMFASNFGINYSRELISNLYIKTGVNYSVFGKNYDESKLTFGDQIDPQTGFTTSTSSRKNRGIRHRYIETPISFRYELGKGKIKLFLEEGISALLYINSKSTFSGNTGRNNSFNPINLTINLSIGVSYDVNDKLQLFLQPMYQTFIFDAYSGSPELREKYYKIGGNIGARFKF